MVRARSLCGPKDHYLLTGSEREDSQQSVGRNVDLEGLIDYGWFSWMSRPLAVPILKAIKWLQQTHRQLRRRHYPLHHCYLLAVFPSEVALFEGDEEGAEACAANEGAAREDQGDEAERPAPEGAAGRAVASDEGRQSARRLSAAADSDAFSVRALPGHHDLA